MFLADYRQQFTGVNGKEYDIDELVKNIDNPACTHIDCLLDELYGSINAAQWDKEITVEEANYLRDKYLGEETE